MSWFKLKKYLPFVKLLVFYFSLILSHLLDVLLLLSSLLFLFTLLLFDLFLVLLALLFLRFEKLILGLFALLLLSTFLLLVQLFSTVSCIRGALTIALFRLLLWALLLLPCPLCWVVRLLLCLIRFLALLFLKFQLSHYLRFQILCCLGLREFSLVNSDQNSNYYSYKQYINQHFYNYIKSKAKL